VRRNLSCGPHDHEPGAPATRRPRRYLRWRDSFLHAPYTPRKLDSPCQSEFSLRPKQRVRAKGSTLCCRQRTADLIKCKRAEVSPGERSTFQICVLEAAVSCLAHSLFQLSRWRSVARPSTDYAALYPRLEGTSLYLQRRRPLSLKLFRSCVQGRYNRRSIKEAGRTRNQLRPHRITLLSEISRAKHPNS
jgi:hypothetical protein